MWDFNKGIEISLSGIMNLIMNEKKYISGVTILGGEPFDQFENVSLLSKKIYESDLSLMLYTGYEITEIKKMHYDTIFKYTDILVCGRYLHEKRNVSLQWRGSDNQSVLFLSDRYSKSIIKEGNYIEIHIDDSGYLEFLGYPDEFV